MLGAGPLLFRLIALLRRSLNIPALAAESGLVWRGEGEAFKISISVLSPPSDNILHY